MWSIIGNIIRWAGGTEPVLLISALIGVVALWGFVELADEVLEGETQAYDEWVVKAMRSDEDPSRPIGPEWMAEAGRDITALGGFAVLTLATLAVLGFLWLAGKHAMMVFVLVASGGGALISHLLKLLFDRPRPDVVPHLAQVYTTSFPSGHSMMSAVVYLTLGALLATVVPRRRLKVYILSMALCLACLVGVSRVYMGVHYPTDVLAGWSVGLVWAVLCWIVARVLQRRGSVESDEPRDTSEAASRP